MKVFYFLFLCGLMFAQDIEFVAGRIDDGYFLSRRGRDVFLTNTCDTISINFASFTEDERSAIGRISVAQRSKKNELNREINSILRALDIRKKPKKRFGFSTRFIINKDSALLFAKDNILGLDTLLIGRSRHKLDSTEIIYFTRKISFADTVTLRNQFGLGNISFVSFYEEGKDKLRILREFVNDPENGWQSE